MSQKLNKILFILFLFLLIIIIGETVYYFFQVIKKGVSSNGLSAKSNSIAIFTDRKVFAKNTEKIDVIFKQNNPDLAIDPKVLFSLPAYKKSLLVSSTMNNSFLGVISALNKNDCRSIFDYKCKLKLTIEVPKKSNLANSFYLTESDLAVTKFFKSKNNENVSITLDSLKVGDLIKIEESINALKTWGVNRTSVVVTLLN